MSRDDAILSAHERLVDALADDMLDAAEDEVLASHTPAAARVAGDVLRQRLRRASSAETVGPTTSDLPPGPSPDVADRPEKKP